MGIRISSLSAANHHIYAQKGKGEEVMDMMKVFSNEAFGDIRTVLLNGEPWFVAADVCRVLEHSNSRMALARLDEDEKGVSSIYTPGGTQEMAIVNEPGLYSLVLGSRKPQARTFRRWIVRDVIPAIRIHGLYATPEALHRLISDPNFAIATLTALQDEREQKAKLEDQIVRNAPKVLFADKMETSDDSILIGSLAKLLRQNGVNIGLNRLFKMLWNEGFLCSAPGERWNMPTQYAMDRGLFEVHEYFVRSGGEERLSHTTKVTGKGQIYFINRFLNRWHTRPVS